MRPAVSDEHTSETSRSAGVATMMVARSSSPRGTTSGFSTDRGVTAAPTRAARSAMLAATDSRASPVSPTTITGRRGSNHTTLASSPPMPRGTRPSGASTGRSSGLTADGKVAPCETPRALETSELPGIIDAFRQGARNALAAGFDGVEIHGANGYLLEQFLQSRSNLRTDQYGGSIENRARLLLEITQAVIEVWDADRVAVRLTPYGIANGSGEADPMPLYAYVVKALDKLGLAYLHFIEPRSSGAGRAEVNHQNVPSAMVLFRPLWSGVLMTAGGFTGETAEAAIAEGHADAIAFGRIFISNPDLPRRLQRGFPITPYNRATFYGGDAPGYTDYPAYDEMAPA